MRGADLRELDDALGLVLAPPFVEDDPHDDAGEADVPLDHGPHLTLPLRLLCWCEVGGALTIPEQGRHVLHNHPHD